MEKILNQPIIAKSGKIGEQAMSRYIDAEILKERLIKNITLTNAIDRSFNEAPSIDIVRCRECKHWNEEDHWCNIRDSYGWDYKPDDFCSYGEREGE